MRPIFTPEHLHALKVSFVFASAWAALFLYTWTLARLALERRPTTAPRFLWTLGCVAYFFHMGGAFDAFYEWSHQAAYEDVALQSMAVTGIEAGWGLYINYLFGAVWAADAIAWWVQGDRAYRSQSRFRLGLTHSFFLFMIFNGAFVFVDNWARWVGLALFSAGLIAASVWLVTQRRRWTHA